MAKNRLYKDALSIINRGEVDASMTVINIIRDIDHTTLFHIVILTRMSIDGMRMLNFTMSSFENKRNDIARQNKAFIM